MEAIKAKIFATNLLLIAPEDEVRRRKLLRRTSPAEEDGMKHISSSFLRAMVLTCATQELMP